MLVLINPLLSVSQHNILKSRKAFYCPALIELL
jgi:hypothetical protein